MDTTDETQSSTRSTIHSSAQQTNEPLQLPTDVHHQPTHSEHSQAHEQSEQHHEQLTTGNGPEEEERSDHCVEGGEDSSEGGDELTREQAQRHNRAG